MIDQGLRIAVKLVSTSTVVSAETKTKEARV